MSDRIDQLLSITGGHTALLTDIKADLQNLTDKHDKRLKSLETTRTRQYAIFGIFSSAIGWLCGR